MSKKRMLIIGLCSPIFACFAVGILLATIVYYAVSGKWAFKQALKEVCNDMGVSK